jgi:hypothetical protein
MATLTPEPLAAWLAERGITRPQTRRELEAEVERLR